ncbi:10 kDa chaperonin [Candidatus Hodgkinia cicadicola]|nr:10 kDa chaperonin [Candidatus Hodgkinia cicadicola]
MKLKPLLDRVIVKPLEPIKRTPSGLILPESVQANVCEAEVLWTAEGVDIDVGSKVLYSKSAGLSFKLSELNVVILKSADVLALVYNE